MADKDYIFTSPDGRKIKVTVPEGEPMPSDAELDKMFASLPAKPKEDAKPTAAPPAAPKAQPVAPRPQAAPRPVQPVAAPKPMQPAAPAFKLPGMDMSAPPQSLLGAKPALGPSSLVVPQPKPPQVSNLSTQPTSVFTPMAVVPPAMKMRQDIDNYKMKYLSPESAKGIPHQLLRAYISAPAGKKEAVIANISDVGKRAIREMASDPVLAYTQRWLTSATPQSAPYKAFVRYASAGVGEEEDALKGLSEEGKTAIRQLKQAMLDAEAQELRKNKATIESTYAREMSKGIPGQTAGLMALGMSAGEQFSVFANMADKGATMLMQSRFRKQPGGGMDLLSPAYADVLALGYDPAGALLPSSGTGGGGAARRAVSDFFLRPSSMAMNVAMEGAFGLGGLAVGATAKAVANTARFQRFAATPRGQAVVRNAWLGGQVALRGGIPATMLAPGIAERDWERVMGEIPIAFIGEALPLLGWASRAARSRANRLDQDISIVNTGVPITQFKPVDRDGNIIPDTAPREPDYDALVAERDRVFEDMADSWKQNGLEDPRTQELSVRLMDLDERVRQHPQSVAETQVNQGGGADAVQVEGPGAGVLRPEESGLGLQEVGQGDQAAPVETAGTVETQTGTGTASISYEATTPQGTRQVTVSASDGSPMTVEIEVPTQGAEPMDAGFVPDIPQLPDTLLEGAGTAKPSASAGEPGAMKPGEYANSLLRRVLNYRNNIYGGEPLGTGTETPRILSAVDEVLSNPDMQKSLIAEALDPTTDPHNIDYRHQVAAAIHETNLRREYQDLTTRMINAKTAAEEARAAGDTATADAADAVYNSLLSRTADIQREGAALIRIAAKVNSEAGTILWLQGAFKNTLDFSNPDVVEVALHQTQTMLSKGAVPDSVRSRVMAEVNAHAKIGEAEYQRVYNEIRRKGQEAQERRTGTRQRTEPEAGVKKQRRFSDEQHAKNIERAKELLRGRVGIIYDPQYEAENALELTKVVTNIVGYFLESGVLKFADVARNVRDAVGNVSDLVLSEAWIKARADARTAWLQSEQGQKQQARETVFAQELINSIGNANQANEFVEAIRDADGQSRILEKLINGTELTPDEAQRATAAWDAASIRRRRADGETVTTQVKQFAAVRKKIRSDMAAAAAAAKKEQARSLEGVRAKISTMLDRILDTPKVRTTAGMDPAARAEYESAVKFKQNVRKIIKDYNGIAPESEITTIVNNAVDAYKNDPASAQGILDSMTDNLNRAGGDATMAQGMRRQMRSNPSFGQYTDEILSKLSGETYQALIYGMPLNESQISEIARAYNDVIPQRQRVEKTGPKSVLEQVREVAANLRSDARREANAVKAAAEAASRAEKRASFDEVKRITDEKLDEIGKPRKTAEATGPQPSAEAKAYADGAKKLRTHINKVLERYKDVVSPADAEAAVSRAVEAYKQDPNTLDGIMSEFTVGIQTAGGTGAAKADMSRRLGRLFGDRVNDFFNAVGPEIEAKLLSGEKLTPDESKIVGDAYVAVRPQKAPAPPVDTTTGVNQIVEAGREALKQGRKAQAAARRAAHEATTLGFLQKKFGKKRGQTIFDLMSDELRWKFDNYDEWTAVDTDELADIIIDTRPEKKAPEDLTDPRYKILREAATVARQKSREYETPEQYRARADEILDRLGTDYEKPKAQRNTNPLLDEATLAYMQGARRLESFKAWVKSNFGDKLSNDEINSLFDAAAKDFQRQTASLVDIKGRIGEEVGRALWDSSSKAERLKMLALSASSIYKMIALTTDMGMLGTQFGLLGLTRPALAAYGKAPRVPQASTMDRARRYFMGGAGGKDGYTAIQAFRKGFASQQGLDEVMHDLELIGESRHGNKDVYYETYRDNPDDLTEPPTPGFDLLSRSSGNMLFGEMLTSGIGSPSTLELMRFVPGLRQVTPLFEKFMRANDAMINTYKVVLFEGMFEPFTHLRGIQRVQAGRAIATAVNTFAGMGRYDKDGRVEAGLRLLSGVYTAPRFYTSNIEVVAPQAIMGNLARSTFGPEFGVAGQMAGVAMAPIRPLARARIKDQPNLPTKEQARIAAVVSSEYVRVAFAMQVLNGILQKAGIGYLATDPEDPNYGSAVINITPDAQKVIPMLGQAGAWHRDITQLVSGRMKDPETGEYKAISWQNKLIAMNVNKMAPPYQWAPVYMIPTKSSTEETTDIMTRQYTLPGGTIISPAEAGDFAAETVRYTVPAPLLMKLVTGDLKKIWENMDAKDTPKIAGAMAGANLLNFFGYSARVQTRPSVLQEIRKEKDYKQMTPSEKRKVEQNYIFGGR